jgi:soluble lytic murein transglycosylase-like protein
MRSRPRSELAALTWGLAVAWTLFCARPARAGEIVATVDEHGHVIYVNADEPASPNSGRTARGFRALRSTAPSLPPAEVDHLVRQAANRNEVDPQLVHAIIQVESEYQPNALSPKGAMGLMQLIPATAMRFGVENPFDPKQNIEGGVTYLKYLLDLFGGNLSLALAAYNAGENSVLRQGGVPSFAETRKYVRKVADIYGAPVNGDAKLKPKEPPKAPIYRYVDAQGVVHFTNGNEF